MKVKKLSCFFAAVIMLGIIAGCKRDDTPPTFAELTAHQLVAQMGTGWNLGNTFDVWDEPGRRLTGDVHNIETLWLGGQFNQTTRTLIQAVRSAGFDTIRIPVTWQKVADPNNNWQIRADWMARVKEVVDWALEENMFVILNTHHEDVSIGIGDASLDTHPGNIFLTNIWRQVAETFRDYDERLIFASLNEPGCPDSPNDWSGSTQQIRDNLNHLNQKFVDVVRATGGNNVYRILQLPTVRAGATAAGMSDFIVPGDPLNPGVNKIAWGIHTYSPFNWAHDGRGTYTGVDSIRNILDNVQKNAERLGIPVILGEWGSISAAVGDGADQDLRNSQRPQHAEDYVRLARERGMVAVWWDNGGFTGTDHTFGIFRRSYPHTFSDIGQQIIDGIMKGAGVCGHSRSSDDCTICTICEAAGLFRSCLPAAPCIYHTLPPCPDCNNPAPECACFEILAFDLGSKPFGYNGTTGWWWVDGHMEQSGELQKHGLPVEVMLNATSLVLEMPQFERGLMLYIGGPSGPLNNPFWQEMGTIPYQNDRYVFEFTNAIRGWFVQQGERTGGQIFIGDVWWEVPFDELGLVRATLYYFAYLCPDCGELFEDCDC